MSDKKHKGSLLEYAVHQLEIALLRAYPQLSGQNVTIERNKHFCIGGIRQEADLWITIAPGTHLESYHLIECKNYSRPVGVAEIDKLARKRERLGAAKALLIAPRFSKDSVKAAAQARVELVKVADEFWPSVASINCFGTTHHCHHASLGLHFRTPDARARIAPILNSTKCDYSGRESTIGEIAEQIIFPHVVRFFESSELVKLEGNHSRQVCFFCEFLPGEFSISDEEVSGMSVWCACTLEVAVGKIVARFSVEGRGLFARFEYPAGTFGLEKPAIEIAGAAVRGGDLCR